MSEKPPSSATERRFKADWAALQQAFPSAELISTATRDMGWTISLPIAEDDTLRLIVPLRWPFVPPLLSSDKFHFTHSSEKPVYSPQIRLLEYVQPFIEKLRIYPQERHEGTEIVEAIQHNEN
jgi:hypothetical protein